MVTGDVQTEGPVGVSADAVVAALQRRIGDDALTIAAQQARSEQQEIEATRLRARVAELEGLLAARGREAASTVVA